MSYRFLLAPRCRLLICALLSGLAGGAGAMDRIRVATGGEADFRSRHPAISTDGRYVTFLGDWSPTMANGTDDVDADQAAVHRRLRRRCRVRSADFEQAQRGSVRR